MGLAYCNSLMLATFQDLGYAVLLSVGAKLVLQGGLGGTVHDTLGTVTIEG